jgi:hypothetical protein
LRDRHTRQSVEFFSMRAHFSCQRWRCVSRCACANHKCRGRARRKATRSRLRRRRDATDRTWARKRVRESRREGVGSRKEFVHCDESAHTNTHTHMSHMWRGARRTNERTKGKGETDRYRRCFRWPTTDTRVERHSDGRRQLRWRQRERERRVRTCEYCEGHR